VRFRYEEVQDAEVLRCGAGWCRGADIEVQMQRGRGTAGAADAADAEVQRCRGAEGRFAEVQKCRDVQRCAEMQRFGGAEV